MGKVTRKGVGKSSLSDSFTEKGDQPSSTQNSPTPIDIQSTPSPDCRRKRTAYTKSQISILEAEYNKDVYLQNSRRQFLSQELGLPEKTIKIWFQNRRMKAKRNGNASPYSALGPFLLHPGVMKNAPQSVDTSQLGLPYPFNHSCRYTPYPVPSGISNNAQIYGGHSLPNILQSSAVVAAAAAQQINNASLLNQAYTNHLSLLRVRMADPSHATHESEKYLAALRNAAPILQYLNGVAADSSIENGNQDSGCEASSPESLTSSLLINEPECLNKLDSKVLHSNESLLSHDSTYSSISNESSSSIKLDELSTSSSPSVSPKSLISFQEKVRSSFNHTNVKTTQSKLEESSLNYKEMHPVYSHSGVLENLIKHEMNQQSNLIKADDKMKFSEVPQYASSTKTKEVPPNVPEMSLSIVPSSSMIVNPILCHNFNLAPTITITSATKDQQTPNPEKVHSRPTSPTECQSSLPSSQSSSETIREDPLKNNLNNFKGEANLPIKPLFKPYENS